MKIGFLAGDFVNWTGGVDFLALVMDSLLASPRSSNVDFHLLIPDLERSSAWSRFRLVLGRSLHKLAPQQLGSATPSPTAARVPPVLAEFSDRLTIRHIPKGRHALARQAAELELDVVLPALHTLGTHFPRAWVAYAYDFQHKYYPQYFSPKDCRSRDEHFADLLTQARAVIVNSRAAAADIAKFVPEATAQVFALPLAPSPNPDWKLDRPEALSQYGVKPPFFLISNQFWIHKDHATAFEAFRRVAACHAELALVCTGGTEDSRDPAYFPKLVNLLRSWGLDQRVRILGMIPKRDQIEIMKRACAVLQPTRFEGGPGGGAVYDSLSIGVPAIVSDLPVNREIEDETVEFFPAGDAAALAGRMEARLAMPQRRIPWEDLVRLGRRRRAACGEVLWRAIDLVA